MALGAAQLQGQTAGVGELNPSGVREPTSFQDCLSGIEQEATRRGISDAIANQNLGNLSPDPDVRMPGMSGPELARVVQERRPDIKIVLTSSYVGEEAVPSGLAFVPKPRRVEQVAKAIKGR